MGIRSQTYFLIPFKFRTVPGSSILLQSGWQEVSAFKPCEIHDYITDRFFGINSVSHIYDKHFSECGFYDNLTGKRICIPFMRLFVYNSEISFAAICAEYPSEHTVDDVISSNAALKFLDNAIEGRFTSELSAMPSGDSFSYTSGILDNLFAQELSDVEKCVSKALIFSYTLCPSEQLNKETLFHLTTGNNRSFCYTDDMTFAEYIQSHEVRQGISREGAARLVCDNGRPFLCDASDPFGLINTYRDSYMLIYVIVLCQYYGFKDFNTRALSLYESHTKRLFSGTMRRMQKLKTDADLFYLRNVHSDISQITHQNDIYRIMLEVYRIDLMVADFKQDIDTCTTLLEQNKFNSRMVAIVISTVIAALAAVLELAANFAAVWDFLTGLIM